MKGAASAAPFFVSGEMFYNSLTILLMERLIDSYTLTFLGRAVCKQRQKQESQQLRSRG
jgi:hypothetical protein